MIYCVAAGLWIFFSDVALHRTARTLGLALETEEHVQTAKGWFFVLATTLLLFVLVRSYFKAFHRQQSRLHERIQTIAHQYQHLFEHNPFPMWVFDPADLRFLAVNDRALEAYGYTRDEFLAMKVTDLGDTQDITRLSDPSAPDDPRTTGLWCHHDKRGVPIEAEVVSHWIDFDGRRATLALAINVTERRRAQRSLEEYRAGLELRVRERTAALSTANDRLRAEIEQRERAEADLIAAKQSAEQASAAKSTYLANTTHEIRTPLTSILGYADLMMDEDIAPAQRDRYVDVIRQNAAHLLKLMDDLLDLTRAEMGKIALNWELESPRDLAAQAIELVRPRAMARGIDLALDAGRDLPASIRADGVRLRQVLLNLLANAIKFTDAGRVTLAISAAPPSRQGASGKAIRFEVRDTGIGISPDNARHIFEPFFQVDQGPTRRYRGFGLGLAISRELIERMGGSIAVTSSPGKGSSFSIELPLSELGVTAARISSQPSDDRLEARVLLAEDDPNIRWLVEEFLRRAGAEVVAVSDGVMAVASVEEDLATRGQGAFDLALLDIHMPGLDGEEVMRRIRTAGYQGAIVALTAQPDAAERESWEAAGCNAVAAKPIDRRTFIPMLAELLRARLAAARSESRS